MKLPLTSFGEIRWPDVPSQSASNHLAIQYQHVKIYYRS